MAQSISGQLIAHVNQIFQTSLRHALTGKVARIGYNVFATDALPSFVLAVAAVEALINETLLGPMSRLGWPDSSLWAVPEASLDRMDIRTKLVIVPQILLGASYTRGAQPYQDFDLLVRLRNDVVHYKMKDSEPKYIKALTQRRVVFTPLSGRDYDWVWQVSCSEAVRWAYNSACGVVAKLLELVPADKRETIFLGHLSENFRRIEDRYVIDFFRSQPELADHAKLDSLSSRGESRCGSHDSARRRLSPS